jgi:hypothetical protein
MFRNVRGRSFPFPADVERAFVAVLRSKVRGF